MLLLLSASADATRARTTLVNEMNEEHKVNGALMGKCFILLRNGESQFLFVLVFYCFSNDAMIPAALMFSSDNRHTDAQTFSYDNSLLPPIVADTARTKQGLTPHHADPINHSQNRLFLKKCT